MVDGEKYTGPQKVSIRAQEIEGCPVHGPEAENFWGEFQPLDLSFSGPRYEEEDFEKETLNFFGLVKVLTDEMAVRLPETSKKFPPFGLPELYREPDMESPDYRPLESLKPDEYTRQNVNSDFQAVLATLNDAYGSKMIWHIYEELEGMYEDPGYKKYVEALAIQRDRDRMRSSGVIADAGHRLTNPMGNARDTMLGIFHVLPAVFEAQFGKQPIHEEAISILRNSKRLAILPSLLSMGQMQSMIVNATEGGQIIAPPYGYDYKPDIFFIGEMKNAKPGELIMDYEGGIGSLPVRAFSRDYGDGDVYAPSIAIDMSSQTKALEDVKVNKATLTCPARKLISAMWDDLVDIADQTRLYEHL